MGMDAELYAIGPYSKAVASALCYPADFYEDVPEGALVVTCVAYCCTSDGSRGLAHALGFEPWAFERHCDILSHTPLEDVNLPLFAESVVEGRSDSVADFIQLAAAGFKFYYLPNG